jgi:hypothetical protein
MSLDNQCMNAISGKRLSSSPVGPGWLCCPHRLLFNLVGTRGFFLWVEWLRNDNEHLLPFSARIKNAMNYSYSYPYASMACTGRTLPLPYLMSTKSVTYVPNRAKSDANILHASVMLCSKMSVAYVR